MRITCDQGSGAFDQLFATACIVAERICDNLARFEYFKLDSIED